MLMPCVVQGNEDVQQQLQAALQHAQQVEQHMADQQQQAAETLQAAEEVGLLLSCTGNRACSTNIFGQALQASDGG